MLDCQRGRFQLPPDSHYLNCAYMAPMAAEVEAAGHEGLRRRRDPSRIPPASFFTESDAVREPFARLVGADDPERIAILPSVSYGMATVARNLELEPGQVVVVTGEQFPSNYYAWSRLARERSLEVRTVEPPGELDGRAAAWNRALLEVIEGLGDRLGAVALPHVHWSDGTVFELEAVGALCRRQGALLVVDGTQSVGALPFDLGRIRPDALVCAAYKSLLGPYSVALAYFGERFDGGRPLEDSWIARMGSEDFANMTSYREEYRAKALRYDMGERSNHVALPMLRVALQLLEELGPSRIQEYCRELVREPIERCRAAGWWIEREEHRASHLFGLRRAEGGLSSAELERLRRELAARRVFVSIRGSAIRVAPHVYNDRADLEALVDALEAALPGPGPTG